MHWFCVVSIICVHLALARSQLSFQPPKSFYDLEQGTEQIVSCLYAGDVNDRVHWMENNSVVSATHQIDLSSLSPVYHGLSCEYDSGSGANETLLLRVIIFILTQLELFPSHTNLSLSTLLSNSTPSYLYCLGYGAPTPLLEWREDNIAFTSIPTSAEFNSSATVVIVIDLKSFPPGLHHLSCFGSNYFSGNAIAFDLFVDSSSPLLITPQANYSYNNTPLYDLEENALLSLHCSIRSFSLPPDSQWVGRKPFWSLATSSGQPTDTVSRSPTLRLSNNTIGTLACVVRSLHNATILTRLVHVSFDTPPPLQLRPRPTVQMQALLQRIIPLRQILVAVAKLQFYIPDLPQHQQMKQLPALHQISWQSLLHSCQLFPLFTCLR